MKRTLPLSLKPGRGLVLLAALLLLTFSLTVLAPPSADALPSCGTYYKYYSDSTYTYQVGQKYYNCSGVLVSSWGTVTSYRRVLRYCCDVEP